MSDKVARTSYWLTSIRRPLLNILAGVEGSDLLNLTAIDPDDGEVLLWDDVVLRAGNLLSKPDNIALIGDPDLYKG